MFMCKYHIDYQIMMFHELLDTSWYYMYTYVFCPTFGLSKNITGGYWLLPSGVLCHRSLAHATPYLVSSLRLLPWTRWGLPPARETATKVSTLPGRWKAKVWVQSTLIRSNSTFQGQRHQKSIEKLGTSKNWRRAKIPKNEPQLLRNTRTWQRQLAQIQHCAELAKPLVDLSSWFRRLPWDIMFLRYFMVFSFIVAFGSAAMGRKR